MLFRILTFFLISNLVFAQDNFLTVDLENIALGKSLKDANIIKDYKSNQLFVILEEEKTTHAFMYNENNELVSEITSDGLKRKYKEIVGHVVDNNQLLLIQKNNKGNKFAYIKYDFTSKTAEEHEYEIEDRSDRFIESFITPNYCIFFTLNFTNDVIKRWKFNINGQRKIETLLIKSAMKSANAPNDRMKDYLQEINGLSANVKFSKINNKIPNNLEITTDQSKMYELEDSFIWTFDKHNDQTILVEFNPPLYNPEVRLINKPKLESSGGTSNSFVFESKIAQVISNNKEMKVEIKSLSEPYSVLKQFHVKKDDEITFKNSPILQEGSTYSFGSTREMEKTSKLLRKMSSDKNGISVHKNNNQYHITIGGTRPQNNGGGMMMMPGGFTQVPGAPSGVMTMSYNPTFYAYGMYTSTGSTRIECLFDANFNHVPGEIGENVFDRIEDFKEILDGYRAESVNFIDDTVIFGYFDKNAKKYFFKSF